jgi:hypothetical protein
MNAAQVEEKTRNGIFKHAKRQLSRVNGSGAD